MALPCWQYAWVAIFSPLVIAQSFLIPPYWRKPTSSLSIDARLELVTGLLNTVTRTLNRTSGGFDGLDVLYETPSMLCGLAIGDHINGSTTNKETVLASLDTIFTQAPTITTLPDAFNGAAAMWGLAAMNAYRAYNDQMSLQYARSAWTQLSSFMVTPEDAASGKHTSKNVTFHSTCRGGSTAGAVFQILVADNTDTNAQVTAAFMSLSAHLYELTLEPSFLAAAELSATFVTGPLSDGNVIIDTITLQTCAAWTGSVTYDCGFAIEGLAVLGSINKTYAALASELISTVIPNPQWTSSDNGTITVEGSYLDPAINNSFLTFKTILIRGLYEAYTRVSDDSREAVLIRDYILVQFNALIDIASTPGSNQYSPQWYGPPPATLLPWGQLAAIDTLYSAVALATNDSSSTPTTAAINPPENTISSTPRQSQAILHQSGFTATAIGGTVAGAIILLLIVTGGAIFVTRRKKQRFRTVGRFPRQLVLDETEEVARNDDLQNVLNSGAISAPARKVLPRPSAIGNTASTSDAPLGTNRNRTSGSFGGLQADPMNSSDRTQGRVNITYLQERIQYFYRTTSTQPHFDEPPPSYHE